MATHFDLLGKSAGSAAPAAPAAPGALANSAISPARASNASIQDSTPLLQDHSGGSSAPPAPMFTGHLPADDPVAKALADPKVSEAFQNAEVQQLLEELRAGRPLEMRELCQQRPHLFRRIKVLLDA